MMRHGWLLPWLFGVANSQAPSRFLQGTVTSTLTTATTTSDPCILAQDECACAAGKVCGWSAFANGGGICQNRGRPTEIDCFLCNTQEKCATTNCPQLTDACDCAAAAGCAWDMGFRMCLVASVQTDCRACPTQAGCNLDPPVLLPNGFNPLNGGSYSGGADLQVVLQFNRPVSWCPGTVEDDDAIFWCSGSVNDQVIPRSKMSFLSTRLTIDMAWYLSFVALESSRTCGVAIGVGRLCDQDDFAFMGLIKGEYSFQLLDTVGPTLDFNVISGEIDLPLDGALELYWSEPIRLNSPTQSAQLIRLEVDDFGITRQMDNFAIPLQAPNVEIVSSYRLRIHLEGLLSPSKLYTVSLPSGAVTDSAGNPGSALPSGRIYIRTGAAVGGSTSVSTSSNAVGVVIVIVCVAVFCILAAGIGLVRLWRLHADAAVNFLNLNKQKGRTKAKSGQHLSPPTVETEKSVPSFGAVNAAAKAAEESAYRAAAAAAERLRTSEDEASGTKPATSAGAGGTWAQRPGSKGPGAGSAGAGNAGNAGNTKPSPKVHPERDGFNAGRARRSNPNAEGAGAGGKADGAKATSAPPPDSNLPPEAKAVEKKLHDLMDAPIATRRKLFKELLVEFHPDKNSSSHAKEVFQYVNNARSWFLVES